MTESHGPDAHEAEALAVVAQGQPKYLKELHDVLSVREIPATIIDPRATNPNA